MTRLSKLYNIPLSTLKLNARILREIGLISYGNVKRHEIIRLTPVGKLILKLLDLEKNSDHLNLSNSYMLLSNDGRDKLSRKIKTNIIKEITFSKSGHLGASLSCADILICIFEVFNPNICGSENTLILSKGHAAPALYAVLVEKGILHEEELLSLRKLGSRLQGHPEKRFIPEVCVSTGSLGQGLSIGVGVAIGKKLKNRSGKVIVLLGDGELDEGQIWEAAMTASTYCLDNLIAIVDRNSKQLNGDTEEIKKKEPLVEKWVSFGWNVILVDGHNIPTLMRTLINLKAKQTKPTIIIANTKRNGNMPLLSSNLLHHVSSYDGSKE
ncbi:MAG: transketolase [Thermoprotei archaeon]|nr:MAG: transketolase [Thermoprotei archaeon]